MSDHITASDNSATSAEIDKMMLAFAALTDLLTPASNDLESALLEIASGSAISPHDVSARVKSFQSTRDKLSKEENNALKYGKSGKKLEDALAARVIVFQNSERKRLEEALKDYFELSGPHNPGIAKRNGYDSDHYVLKRIVQSAELAPFRNRYRALGELFSALAKNPIVGGLELQVRTVAGHAWAEYEHDIRYKLPSDASIDGAKQKQIDQLFIEAGGVRKFMDDLFQQIGEIVGSAATGADETLVLSDSAMEKPSSESDEGFDDEHQPGEFSTSEALREDLLDFLANKYPEASEPTEGEVDALIQHFANLGWTTVEPLEDITDELSKDTQTRIGEILGATSARRLDDDLLALLGKHFVTTAPGTFRLRKRNLARRLSYLDGRYLIYEYYLGPESGAEEPENRRGPFSARGMRTDVSREAVAAHATRLLNVDGQLSMAEDIDKSNISPSCQRTLLETEDGDPLVIANDMASKPEIEDTVIDVLAGLAEKDGLVFRVWRAGDELSNGHMR